MNKRYLKVPAEYFWIIPKRDKASLLSELKRRVEVLNE